MKFGSNLFKGLRSLEAAPQVARRSERNSPFETRCPARVSTQIYKKKDRPFRTVFPMSALCAQRVFRSLALILSAHGAEIKIVTYGPASDDFLF